MQLFYVPTISGDKITLDGTESKHCIKVLRLANGDKVQAIDGKGGFYEAEIVNANPKKCELQILKSIKEFKKRDFRIHIAIAPTKNTDRFEWFLEKATEIGIDEITPVICDHSERKVLKEARLEKVMIAAIKQSLKAYLPKLNPIISFDDFIAADYSPNKFIAHCVEGNKTHLKDEVRKMKNIIVLVGPEGDFSAGEIERAKKNGFTEISLGRSRLRTETAGIVACLIINLANEQ